jgi:hypothetical protein
MAAAVDYIPVANVKTWGQQTVTLGNMLRTIRAMVSDQKAAMDHLTDGTTDFTKIEAQFGLAAGDGIRLYTLMSTLNTQITGSTAVNDFANKVQAS